jgi:hypothetical protein
MVFPDVREIAASDGNDRPRIPELPVPESPRPTVLSARAATELHETLARIKERN